MAPQSSRAGLRPLRTCAVVAILALFSGCAGAEDPLPADQDQDEQIETPTVTFSDETGGIAGLVVDDTILPIQGVEVLLLESRTVTEALAQAVTDRDGRFVFSNLAPGTYQVSASKSGFGNGSALAQVRAGEAVEVQVTLDDVANDDPFVEYLIQRGILRCGFSYVAFADTCGIEDVMGETKNQVDFNVSAGHQWLVVETDWNEHSATMDHDFFTRDPGDDPRGTIVGRGYGTPILRADFWPEKEYQATPVADPNHFPASDADFVFRIETYYDGQYQQEINDVAGPACDYMLLGYCTGAGVALDFTFTDYLSVFVNGVPEDIEGHTAVPDR